LKSFFAEKVKRRDGRCLICQSNKQLQAHHLYSKSAYPAFRGHLDNGVTLCEKHHQEFHRKYPNHCTGFDFLEWLYKRQERGCGVSRKLLVQLFGRVMSLHRQLDQTEARTNGPDLWKQVIRPASKVQSSISVKTELMKSDYEVVEAYCRKMNVSPEQGLRWFILLGCQQTAMGGVQ
jgi:hypothetical protein